MRNSILILFVIFIASNNALALKPKKGYDQSPKDWEINYSVNRIKVDSFTTLNSWYLQPISNRKNITILISNADYGNMSTFLLNGATLYDLGYDVVMYDYRGFGASSAFVTDTNMLFYKEYVSDLSSVYSFYKKQTPNKRFVLMGFSMGTIISTIFIAQDSLQNQLFIYDGFVNSIDSTLSIINKSKRKKLKAPVMDNEYNNYLEALSEGNGLIFNGSNDKICKISEYFKAKFNVIDYEGGHLQGFYKLSENGITGSLYNQYIIDFIRSKSN